MRAKIGEYDIQIQVIILNSTKLNNIKVYDKGHVMTCIFMITACFNSTVWFSGRPKFMIEI